MGGTPSAKVGLKERRCMEVFGVLGLTAYHRFLPPNPLTDGWWVTHMRWVPALKPSKRVGETTRGNGKNTTKVGWGDTLVRG